MNTEKIIKFVQKIKIKIKRANLVKKSLKKVKKLNTFRLKSKMK